MPNNKTSGKTKNSAQKKPTAKTTANTKPRQRKIRKPSTASLVAAGIMAVMGVFLAIGYINSEGAFIKIICNAAKGLFGFGYYFMPPTLIISAFILAFSRKRTAVFRAVCIVCIPFFAGAVFQLIKGIKLVSGIPNVKILWQNGIALKGGGVVSGAFSALLTYLFSAVGAWFVVVLFGAIDLFFAVGTPINKLFSGKSKKKKKNKEKDELYQDFKEELIYSTSEPEIKTEKRPLIQPREEAASNSSKADNKDAIRSQIDIPIDPPRNERKTRLPGLFNRRPNVSTPDEFISGNKREVSEVEIETVVNEEEVPGFPAEPDVSFEAPIKPFIPAVEETAKEEEAEPVIITPAAQIKQRRSTAVEEKNAPTAEEDFEAEIAETAKANEKKEYIFPPLSLLSYIPSGSSDSREEVRANTQRLENTLRSFGVNAQITNIVRGPTITRYETELEIGVKLNKLTSLSDDIALALGASGVRIAAVPNKISTVGIEVPNRKINTVYLREIIDSDAFRKSESKISFAIGKSISGEAVVGNIAKLPHLLVAGTTGSGKSVCLNSLILSILYKARPEEVKFIMIDPKMVEFRVYNGIPHLLVPVVTEAKKAGGALQWAVTEMMKRYRLFSETGARDLSSYNSMVKRTGEGETIPQIVVIIDELADLMLVAAKEVEESICRIAQMGRAAGIHLIIATQSPRADVITGLMKANISSRISFKVTSSLESRIILDSRGSADKLVGNGDMLYSPIGSDAPARIQGAWVTDEERESIVEFVKQSGTAEYSQDIIKEIERNAEDKKTSSPNTSSKSDDTEDSDVDAMYNQAVEIVLEMGQASVSMLQRRLKLGYSRAARLVDQMEEKGVVGPFEGSKPRQVLITKQQWQEMQFIRGTADITPVSNLEPGQTMESASDLFDD